MSLNRKISVEFDEDTMRRIHVARDRISAETGVPKISLSGTITALVKKAAPKAGAKPDAEN